MTRRTVTLLFFLCILTLATICWSYYPGLSGSFLFDDFVNLPGLGNFGPVDNWHTFIRYITSGTADPTGRPLALLTFLFDANNWPASPRPFKETNLIIHLLNSCLLFWLLLLLGKKTGKTKLQINLAAILSAGIWALHPLWISTTLYIVQREAMLPTAFTLLGLIAHVHGREKFLRADCPRQIWLLGSVITFTLLAVLSKANGILLPTLIAVVEFAFLQPFDQIHKLRDRASTWLLVTCYSVTTLLVIYLVWIGVSSSIYGLSTRPWTEGQRILTEPRVVFDYLSLLIFPHPYSRGLFNDGFPVSVDLFEPWTTLPAILGITALFITGCLIRKRAPTVALAILFYLAGQLLESTTIPLELYFEHRNYLPALLFFWPLSLWLVSDGAVSKFKPAISIGIIVVLGLETRVGAAMWGNPDIQALVWAAQNPDSPRAQAYAAQKERAAGLLTKAEDRLRKALLTHPDEIQLAINLLGVRCDSGEISNEDFGAAESALIKGSNRGPLTFEWISSAINLAENKSCAGLTSERVQDLIDAARQNRQAIDRAPFKQDLLNLEGQLALSTGDVTKADEKFRAALAVFPKPDVALKQAAILGSHGLAQLGLAELNYFGQLLPENSAPKVRDMAGFHAWLLYRDGYWDKEFEHLRSILQSDLDSSNLISPTAISK